MPPTKRAPKRARSEPSAPSAPSARPSNQGRTSGIHRDSAYWTLTWNAPEQFSPVSASASPQSPQLTLDALRKWVEDKSNAYVITSEGDDGSKKQHYHIALRMCDRHGKTKSYRSDNATQFYKQLGANPPELKLSCHEYNNDWQGCLGYVCKDGTILHKYNLSDDDIKSAVAHYEVIKEKKDLNRTLSDTKAITVDKLPMARAWAMAVWGATCSEEADRLLFTNGYSSRGFNDFDPVIRDIKRRRTEDS